MAGDVIYSHAHKCFYFYDPVKGLWRECEDDSVINFQFVEITTAVIRKLMGEIPQANTEEEQAKNKAEQKLYLKAQNSCDLRAKQMVKDFLPAICRAEIDPATYFNKDADLLPLENGVWKFSEKRMIPYEREHFFTFRIPVPYNPKADTSLIRKTVAEWFNGDEEVIKFVQYYIGYCLTGNTNRQDFLIAWGNAAGNGKSLLWGSIMKRLLGDPHDTTKNSFWGEITTHAISTSAGENNDQLYNIDGKRFVMLSEPQEGQKNKIDTNLLKKLTGDRTHTCSAKYKNAKTFNIVAKFQISCNDIPDMKLDTPAMKRRCLVVEQNVAFREDDEYSLATDAERASGKVRRKDDTLEKRLLDDAVGLMAWALEGAKAYVDDPTRQPPEAMMNAKAKAQTNTDALGTWIKGNIRNLKTLAVADRPAGWERKKVSLKELKDMWKSADLFPESRKSGFNTTFCDKARQLGYEVDAGRSGKSEEKITFAELIADEEETE
jgi:putative DNA primase/helicase